MSSGIAAGGAGGIMPATSSTPPVTSGPTAPPTLTPDPFAARGAPVRLEIPAIRVDAALETSAFTQEGAIGAPKDWDKAAWHGAGFRPGEPGNALIAGHLDNDRGGPAVFWDLNELAAGDEVRVTYANGDHVDFQVDGSELVDSKAQDGQTFDRILGPATEPRLNLMTCDGAWDHGAATYTKRLVVFTKLAPAAQISPSPSLFGGGGDLGGRGRGLAHQRPSFPRRSYPSSPPFLWIPRPTRSSAPAAAGRPAPPASVSVPRLPVSAPEP